MVEIMDIVSSAVASVARFNMINVAHSIERIEFREINGERVRIDYGIPRYWGDKDSAYCGFTFYQYQAFIFINTACNDNEKYLRHEIKHIEQFQWYYHPLWNETRRPLKEYLFEFEKEAYLAQEGMI